MIPKHRDACDVHAAVIRSLLIAALLAHGAITPPVRLAAVPGVESAGIDSAGRIYALGGGRVTVLSPQGALLAGWSVAGSPRGAVLPGGGIVTASGTDVTRWSPEGAVVSRWSTAHPSNGSLPETLTLAVSSTRSVETIPAIRTATARPASTGAST